MEQNGGGRESEAVDATNSHPVTHKRQRVAEKQVKWLWKADRYDAYNGQMR